VSVLSLVLAYLISTGKTNELYERERELYKARTADWTADSSPEETI
jgi:hypothetical protein